MAVKKQLNDLEEKRNRTAKLSNREKETKERREGDRTGERESEKRELT